MVITCFHVPCVTRVVVICSLVGSQEVVLIIINSLYLLGPKYRYLPLFSEVIYFSFGLGDDDDDDPLEVGYFYP